MSPRRDSNPRINTSSIRGQTLDDDRGDQLGIRIIVYTKFRILSIVSTYLVRGTHDVRPYRRSADGSDGSKKGQRFPCRNGTRMRRRPRQSDTERLQRDDIGAEGRGEQGEAGGLPNRLTPGFGHHRHDASPLLRPK